jgi:hypothetical protein
VQPTIDRIDRAYAVSNSGSGKRVPVTGADERAARQALRAQVAKLERELSGIVVEGFPHIRPPAPAFALAREHAGSGNRSSDNGGNRVAGGPRLLNLGQLERTRDELAGMVQAARRAAAERAELETRSRELLRRMQNEPGRYKFVRLPVRDLGEHGCGVWEVRPRLGMLGMLAGWWQVKLSSGCPLPGGHAARRGPERRSHRSNGHPARTVAPGSGGCPGHGRGRSWAVPGQGRPPQLSGPRPEIRPPPRVRARA